MNDLRLVEPVDRLGESVVMTVADAADGWLDARFGLDRQDCRLRLLWTGLQVGR